MTPETQYKITAWQQRALIPSNQSGALTKAEMFEIVKILRDGRGAAIAASDVKRTAKAKMEILDADEMLGEMLRGGS